MHAKGRNAAMATNLNDQTALGLVSILVRRISALQGTLAKLAFDAEEPRKHATKRGPSTFMAVENAHEPLFYLAQWFHGGSVVRCEINGDFFTPDPSLTDRGCLIIVRRLFEAVDRYSYALRAAGEDEGRRLTAFEDFNKIVRKCFVLMQLWDIGEDLTHMTLSFDWAKE
jgi:hypothetical protein